MEHRAVSLRCLSLLVIAVGFMHNINVAGRSVGGSEYYYYDYVCVCLCAMWLLADSCCQLRRAALDGMTVMLLR